MASTTTPCSNGRAIGRDEGPCQPKLLPPTLTAFTSRLPSPAKSGEASKSTASTASTATITASTATTATTLTTTSNSMYIGGSAISFDSDEEEDDDEWEDDCGPLRLAETRNSKHYDERGNMIFGRIAVPKATPQTSLLTQMLQQQQASGMALASDINSFYPRSSTRRATSTATAGTSLTSSTTVMTDAQFPIDFPNPLRCHPTASRSPVPAVSDVPQLSSSPASSSSSSSSSSVASSPSSALPIVHIPQLAGGLLFVHRSPRAIVDSTGPFTSMPFNGACGPRADPTVVVGAPPHREICCNGRLLRGELSSTLHTSILDENNSRYIFRQYGSRRCVSRTEESESEEMPFPPVRRTQSAPDVLAVARDACRLVAEAKNRTAQTDKKAQMTADQTPSATCAAMAIPASPAADTVLRHGVRDYRSFQFRKIEYVDDYVAPSSWSWGSDYHSKGW